MIKQALTFATVLGIGSVCAQVAPSIEWQQTYGGLANAVQQTIDGGYVFAGNHGWDFWVVKLNDLGDTLWQKSLGGTSSDDAHAVEQTTDGGYIVAGLTYSNDGDVTGYHYFSDAWVVKLDDAGNIIWQRA